MNRFNRYFIAEPVAGTPPPAVAPGGNVTAEASPTSAAIPTVDSKATAPATIVVQPPPAKEPRTKIISATDALGLAKKPGEALDDMATALKDRIDKGSNVTPLPKKNLPKKGAAKPLETQAQPPVVKGTAAAEKPPEPVKEVEPKIEGPKVKLADGKELTIEEAAAKIAELEKKGTAPEAKAADVPPPAPGTPEEAAAAIKKERDEFIEKAAAKCAMSEEENDTFLSGGPKSIALFARKQAERDLEIRDWASEQMNKIIDAIEERDRQIAPVLATYAPVLEHQKEAGFYAANPDLIPHKENVKNVEKAFRAKYPEQTAAMTTEEFNTHVAEHVRQILPAMGIQIAPVTAPPAPPAKPAVPAPAAAIVPATPQAPPAVKAPTPEPPTGQLGGIAAPAAVNEQAAMAQQLR